MKLRPGLFIIAIGLKVTHVSKVDPVDKLSYNGTVQNSHLQTLAFISIN